MALFTAEGLTYPQAEFLIKHLKERGIDSNITVGGVAIHPTPGQISQAQAICTEHRASFSAGYSMSQEDFLLKRAEYEHVEKVTNNAQSIIQEWTDK